jgi:hypothetical protein
MSMMLVHAVGDEYDSGEEVIRTKEDDDFIDEDDDNPDLVAEYNAEKQVQLSRRSTYHYHDV